MTEGEEACPYGGRKERRRGGEKLGRWEVEKLRRGEFIFFCVNV